MSNTWKFIIGILAVVALIVVVYFATPHPVSSGNHPLLEGEGSATTTSVTTSQTTNNTVPSKPMNYTQATFMTNMGSFTIAFDPKLAPNTVANFEKLAVSGFYDKVKFHRIIAGFMIQGGDPLSKDDSQQSAWGTGGPGYQFADEITPDSKNMIGAVAMANSGPNTNGSQFFINVADNSYLNGHYSVFAHVTSGYDVVEKISKVKTVPGDRPVESVVIESITLK
jgi:cyclophilin family peptidyl-prolyl cis-trans isomerase